MEGEDSLRPRGGRTPRCRVEKGDGETVHVRGRLTARLGVECARCLEAFHIRRGAGAGPLLPAPWPGLEAEEDDELSDREMVVAYYDDGRLDLGEMMREQLFLGSR